jgi:hypothetical protein
MPANCPPGSGGDDGFSRPGTRADGISNQRQDFKAPAARYRQRGQPFITKLWFDAVAPPRPHG